MRINRENTSAPAQEPEPLDFAKEIHRVLNYDKNLTYYLTVTYDMFRLYVVYLIIYGFIAAKCSWAFIIFATFMCCSILYILDRGVVVTLKRHFDRRDYDEYHLHTSNGESQTPQQPQYNYVYTTLKNPNNMTDSTIYF